MTARKNTLTRMCAASASVALVVLVGCGPDGGGECARPLGIYHVDFAESSGTCGDWEMVVWVDDSADGDCEVMQQTSADNCHRESQIGCPIHNEQTGAYTGSIRLTASLSANTLGTRLDGHAEISFSDERGEHLCRSVGALTYTKQ